MDREFIKSHRVLKNSAGMYGIVHMSQSPWGGNPEYSVTWTENGAEAAVRSTRDLTHTAIRYIRIQAHPENIRIVSIRVVHTMQYEEDK